MNKSDPNKTNQENDTPTKIIRENANRDLHTSYFIRVLHTPYFISVSLAALKLANITSKENFRHVSILPNLSKLFEDLFSSFYPF